jgi:2'-5' RNA ligase
MTERTPMRDHWYWRPGWRVGRSFFTWHVTFSTQPEVRRVFESYAPMLAGLPMVDPVPLRWLHLTLQGIGFTDDVNSDDVARIIEAAQERCAHLSPFTVTLGPAEVDPEGIQLPVRSVEPVAALRREIRGAIGDVWGSDNIPESAEGFRPHVSLGYANAAGPAEPLAAALDRHRAASAEVLVSQVSLIDLNRDSRSYEWSDVGTAVLGSD